MFIFSIPYIQYMCTPFQKQLLKKSHIDMLTPSLILVQVCVCVTVRFSHLGNHLLLQSHVCSRRSTTQLFLELFAHCFCIFTQVIFFHFEYLINEHECTAYAVNYFCFFFFSFPNYAYGHSTLCIFSQMYIPYVRTLFLLLCCPHLGMCAHLWVSPQILITNDNKQTNCSSAGSPHGGDVWTGL